MGAVDNILLQSILDRFSLLETRVDARLTAIDNKVDTIVEKQAVIAERIDNHIAGSKTASDKPSKIDSTLGFIRSLILPIVLAIFLLGRQSVEYTHQPLKQYPPSAIVGSGTDDTFVARNKRIDSILIKQIMNGTK